MIGVIPADALDAAPSVLVSICLGVPFRTVSTFGVLPAGATDAAPSVLASICLARCPTLPVSRVWRDR